MLAKYLIGWNGSVAGAAGLLVTVTTSGWYQFVESNVIVAGVVAVAGVNLASPAGPATSVWPSRQIVMTTCWPTSGAFTMYTVAGSYSDLGGIAAGPDGNLWFTEGGPNKVAEIVLKH